MLTIAIIWLTFIFTLLSAIAGLARWLWRVCSTPLLTVGRSVDEQDGYVRVWVECKPRYHLIPCESAKDVQIELREWKCDDEDVRSCLRRVDRNLLTWSISGDSTLSALTCGSRAFVDLLHVREREVTFFSHQKRVVALWPSSMDHLQCTATIVLLAQGRSPLPYHVTVDVQHDPQKISGTVATEPSASCWRSPKVAAIELDV